MAQRDLDTASGQVAQGGSEPAIERIVVRQPADRRLDERGNGQLRAHAVRVHPDPLGGQLDLGFRPLLAEAVLLATIGGLIGIVLGVGGSLAIAAFTEVPASITWWSIAPSFGVSAAVGVFFGVAPTRRASRLDPVIALRAE